MKIMDKIREQARNFLRIEQPQGMSINIQKLKDFDAYCFENELWYHGEANELQQFYMQLYDGVGNNSFWGSQSSKGMKMRKIHTGLPGMIVDVLTDICTDDLYKIELSDRQDEWDKIAEKNDFKQIISDAVRDTFVFSDGAFKLSIDESVSEYPIIEFIPGDRVEYEYTRGSLTAVIFKTPKVIKGSDYLLKERYSKDSISYVLENSEGRQVDIKSFSEFEGLINVTHFAGIIPAVPMKFRASRKYKGRGKSLFDGKLSDFDAFDEVFSQIMLALRKGQMKSYIPSDFIPRDPKTGVLRGYNDFDNDFISIESPMSEGDKKQITTTQGNIQHEALVSIYCTALDLCLQGIISPSTLGIDVKKLDNAEAQREKEKTTLYTRGLIIDTLADFIPRVINTVLKSKAQIDKKPIPADKEITLKFGEYANPSFEAQVETVTKGKQGGIMSIEASVEELYKDDKDEEWKQQEVARLKAEQGIIDIEEPAVNYDLEMNEDATDTNVDTNKVENQEKEQNTKIDGQDKNKKDQENINE